MSTAAEDGFAVTTFAQYGGVLLDFGALSLLVMVMMHLQKAISKRCRLPAITVYLLSGTICRAAGLFRASTTANVLPLHQAALAIITFAAGSELEADAVRSNLRLVASITMCLTVSALACVFTLHLLVTSLLWPEADDAESILEDAEVTQTRRVVGSMLAAVIAIARSPSSAMGVVTELEADGPFTQTVLVVTMSTDVVVVVVFLAAAEAAEAMLSPAPSGPSHAFVHFIGRTAFHLGLSIAHGLCLSLLCLATLRLPLRHLVLRFLVLLAVGLFAFRAEALLHLMIPDGPLDELVRLEPMMSCIIAGCLLVNGFGKRRAFGALLQRSLPLVLCFFFVTTGIGMDIHSLAQTWPLAGALFAARLLSLRIGYAAGAAISPPTAPKVVRAPSAWLAFITQAGVGLGLAEEVGDRFAPWAEGLRTSLVASIVLNQVVGPPLLRLALYRSGEVGNSRKRDRIAEALAYRLTSVDPNPKALESLMASAAAIATALASAAVAPAAGTPREGPRSPSDDPHQKLCHDELCHVTMRTPRRPIQHGDYGSSDLSSSSGGGWEGGSGGLDATSSSTIASSRGAALRGSSLSCLHRSTGEPGSQAA